MLEPKIFNFHQFPKFTLGVVKKVYCSNFKKNGKTPTFSDKTQFLLVHIGIFKR